MTIVSISPPPGVWKNGTRYQAKGRYFDANLVRWQNGSLRPVGGWARYTNQDEDEMATLLPDASLETVRDSFSWRTNTDQGIIAYGSNLRLLTQLLSGVVTDITPTGLAAGRRIGTVNQGYNKGFYNFGVYGVPPRLSSSTVNSPAARWYFDTWGEDLLALPNWVGTIYRHSVGGGVASPVTNAPTNLTGFVVTDERVLMTIGDDVEPRLVQWSDQEDLTNWDFADIGNQAGFFTLPGVGRLIAITKMQGLILIFSETDVYVAQYVGPPFVYTFRKIAENCSPLHPKAIATTEQFVIWVGPRNVWIFDGASVQALDCEIIDHVVKEIDPSQASTSFSWVNHRNNEVWWHYATQNDDNPDPACYAVFNWKERHWNIGKLDRTTAIPIGVANNPIMVDYDGFVYEHELSSVGFPAGYEAFAETGPLEQGNGDSNLAIRRVLMDTVSFGAVSISFTSRQSPTGPERQFGPYTYNNPIPVKVSGREVQLKIKGVLNDWEVGVVRADIIPIGRTAR